MIACCFFWMPFSVLCLLIGSVFCVLCSVFCAQFCVCSHWFVNSCSCWGRRIHQPFIVVGGPGPTSPNLTRYKKNTNTNKQKQNKQKQTNNQTNRNESNGYNQTSHSSWLMIVRYSLRFISKRNCPGMSVGWWSIGDMLDLKKKPNHLRDVAS